MEYLIVDIPTRDPRCCSLCRGHQGPFLEVPGIKMLGLATIEGPLSVEAGLAFCIGPDQEHPGCVYDLARFLGCPLPWDAEDLRRELAEAKAALTVAAEKLTLRDSQLSQLSLQLADARSAA